MCPARAGEAVREGVIDDAFYRRPVAVDRVDYASRHREAGVLDVVVVGVDIVETPSTAHDQLLLEHVCEADAWLYVVPVSAGREVINAVDAREKQAALQLGKNEIPPSRILDRVIDQRVYRADDIGVKAAIESVIPFVRRPIDVPAQAEIERQLAIDLPVVLEPGRDVFVECGRVGPVFNLAAHVAEQERGDAVAAVSVTSIKNLLCEAATGGQLEWVPFVSDDVLRPAYVSASAPCV